jgi:adenylate kinase family enzyme
MGDLLRKEVEQDTPIGRTAATLMRNGQMVPTSIVLQLLIKSLSEYEHSKGVLIGE